MWSGYLVERVLGEADLVTERPRISALGHWVRMEMGYIDHGYVVYLANSRVRGTSPITEDRGDLRRRSTVYKNVLKGRIKRGDTGAAVIKALGGPNIVWKERIDNGCPGATDSDPMWASSKSRRPRKGRRGTGTRKTCISSLSMGACISFAR